MRGTLLPRPPPSPRWSGRRRDVMVHTEQVARPVGPRQPGEPIEIPVMGGPDSLPVVGEDVGAASARWLKVVNTYIYNPRY